MEKEKSRCKARTLGQLIFEVEERSVCGVRKKEGKRSKGVQRQGLGWRKGRQPPKKEAVVKRYRMVPLIRKMILGSR